MTDRKVIDLTASHSVDLAHAVLVYGHFNLIHPGHRRFLTYARSLGAPLVVAVQGDSSLTSTQRDHYYTEHDRTLGVAALDIVDFVIPLGHYSLLDAVEGICPALLLLGSEHANDVDPGVREAIDRQLEQSRQVRFHAGEAHNATSEFLRVSADALEESRSRQFEAACKRQSIGRSNLAELLERLSGASVLVVGDTIVDSYIACDPLGMSAEAPVIVVQEIESRDYVGGAGVVAAHVAGLGASAHYVSVVGADSAGDFAKNALVELGVKCHLVQDPSRPTTFKTRYLVENQKLFRVSRLQDHEITGEVEQEVINCIRDIAPSVEAIVISDFVYGVVTPAILDVVAEVSREYGLITLADLQCSSQVGDVGKFSGMSVLCPTEKEARIALSSRSEGLEWVATRLMDVTQSSNLILKLGQDGFIGYEMDGDRFVNREHFPALSTDAVDPAGAGDSLLASLATGMAAGASLMESAALGAIVASIVVRTVGNQPITRERIESALMRWSETV